MQPEIFELVDVDHDEIQTSLALIVHPKMNSGNEFPSAFAPVFTALRRSVSLRRDKSARFQCGIRNADCGIVPLKTMSRLMSAATGEKISSRRQFDARQRGLKCAEKFFLLPDDGIRRGQLLFQSQAGARLGEAQDAPPASQLDEVELNFIAVNHKFILLEICEIATGD
jgi:hypothetical protein